MRNGFRDDVLNAVLFFCYNVIMLIVSVNCTEYRCRVDRVFKCRLQFTDYAMYLSHLMPSQRCLNRFWICKKHYSRMLYCCVFCFVCFSVEVFSYSQLIFAAFLIHNIHHLNRIQSCLVSSESAKFSKRKSK